MLFVNNRTCNPSGYITILLFSRHSNSKLCELVSKVINQAVRHKLTREDQPLKGIFRPSRQTIYYPSGHHVFKENQPLIEKALL